ncbi:hypothetical protein [Sutcliffiella cohnii]|uniref:hypothetical protein n=1 Tax=Sutcliffiella cohnii TaxID=33932 RepID=UPI002E24AA73|nr:hypothetical protein [Sutcliffiella cohnii]
MVISVQQEAVSVQHRAGSVSNTVIRDWILQIIVRSVREVVISVQQEAVSVQHRASSNPNPVIRELILQIIKHSVREVGISVQHPTSSVSYILALEKTYFKIEYVKQSFVLSIKNVLDQ